MSDFSSRQVIEALRSGVPSRAVGAFFSEARPGMMRRLNSRLDELKEKGTSGGMIFTGRYGEGKTHLLNTVFSMAEERGMAVSWAALGKETPMNRPDLLYRKLMAATYLPSAKQPGFRAKLEELLIPGGGAAAELLAYAARELESDKLYYLLKGLMDCPEDDDRETLLADLEGDFTTDGTVKKIFRRATGTPAKFSQSFSKRKHIMDYYRFMSRLFQSFGCSGWVLLFDEAELVGRFAKKARARSYCEIQRFLRPEEGLERTFALFAFSSSYGEDVIDRKHEFENVEAIYESEAEEWKAATDCLNSILNAPELSPLTTEEIRQILLSIRDFHARAYDWTPAVSEEKLLAATESGGYLLRTKIRAAIEFLDQLYQYGDAGETHVTALDRERLEEEDAVPELGALDEL